MKPSTKDQVKGKLHEVEGEHKAKAGQLTNRPGLTAEGRGEKFAGRSKRKLGRLKQFWRSSQLEHFRVNWAGDPMFMRKEDSPC